MMEMVILYLGFGLLGAFMGSGLLVYLGFVLIFFMLIIMSELGDGFFLDSLFYYDSLSVGLVVLSIWVGGLMVFSSYSVISLAEFSLVFMLLVYSLVFTLVITFFSGSLLLFYFFFEASLIPTLLIIMGWGYQPERLQAGVYFLFYTLTASLPLLILIIWVYESGGSLVFFLALNEVGGGFSQVWILVGFMGMLAFLVSLPLYFTHLWLPSAHVEAPVAGSMILAGVLLSLGGYGLMRVFLWLGAQVAKMGHYLVGLSLVGMVYVGLICCRINDFSALVAYSSVAHMAMVVCGVMAVSMWGFEGALMMMIGHGLSSSGLFCAVNMYYERTGSRSFYMNSGMLVVLPVLALLFFMLSAANIAAPPTINLMSEIFLMVSIMNYDFMMLVVFPLGSMLGAVFTIFMFSYSQHGSLFYSLLGFNFVSLREAHVLTLHVAPINLMVLGSNLFFSL